ncbi:MAG TPA: PQQ-binding-like beta-propeller repeat protein [Tepidisphaeraceae bacterium]|jgi:outer membrane protein assembly factor BamB|nr:PQQ-binding-like beta-propeller repeat protein [Tepidisphaeraceae bacterium]
MDVIAVVPIFMSAGAAALPTIVAALTAVAALVFKPRALLQTCRRRPVLALSAIAGIAGVILFSTWLLTPAQAARRVQSGDRPRQDWAKVAERILALEQTGKAPTLMVAQAMDVPLFLGRDMSRRGYDGGAIPVGLKQIWNFRPDETMFLSVSAITAHYVYAAGCQTDVGGFTGLLACLDAETGAPIWQIAQANDEPLRPFFSSPALSRDGKNLVIGQGLHDDHDCSLLCFDATDGHLRWSVKTPLHIESSPAIFGDIAVAGAGAIEGKDGKAVGDPGYVLAVSISDGRELWRQSVNDPESSPAIDDAGVVYIGSGFNGSAVIALRSETDQELQDKKLPRVIWQTPVAYPVTSAITLAGDLAIAGAGNSDYVYSNPNPQGAVVALDRKTGQIRWRTNFQDAVLGEVAYADGKLICPLRTGEVTALNAVDGTVLWRARVSGAAPVLAGCALAGNRVYAVSRDGYLAIIDANDGKVLEKTYLNDQARPGTGLSVSAPQVVGGRVIAGSETGGLKSFVGSGNAP